MKKSWKCICVIRRNQKISKCCCYRSLTKGIHTYRHARRYYQPTHFGRTICNRGTDQKIETNKESIKTVSKSRNKQTTMCTEEASTQNKIKKKWPYAKTKSKWNFCSMIIIYSSYPLKLTFRFRLQSSLCAQAHTRHNVPSW